MGGKHGKKAEKIIRERERRKEPAKDCDHVWEQMGYWDGTDEDGNRVDKDGHYVGGPIAKCTKCEGFKYFNWEEWNVLSKEKKIELHPRRGNN